MPKSFPVHTHRPIPEVLYKYRPWNDQTRSSIINGEIWFASPNDFNDPFEFRFVPTLPTSESEIESLSESTSIHHYPNDTVSERNTRIRDFKEEITRYNGVSPLIDDKMRSGFAVCCMSEIPDNLLMWSHYADAHCGVCIGVATKDIPSLCSIAEVEYAKSPSRIPFNGLSFVEHRDELHRVARTKSIQWSYELEWRLVRVLVEPGLMKLPSNSIVSVTVGCRASKKTCLEVLESLDLIDNDVTLNVAQVNREKYQLDIVPPSFAVE